MPVTERDRNLAYNSLSEKLDPATADVLMELLPHKPAAELVTGTELLAASTQLQGEMAELRGSMQAEMANLAAELRSEMANLAADLRAEMANLAADLRAEMADLRTEMRTEMADLRAEMRTEMANLAAELRAEIRTSQRWTVGLVVANTLAVITALMT